MTDAAGISRQTSGQSKQHEEMLESSSPFSATATLTRVRPRAFVYGISAMFDQPPIVGRPPKRPTHLPDIAPSVVRPRPNSYTSTLRSRIGTARFTADSTNTRIGTPLHPEESTLDL